MCQCTFAQSPNKIIQTTGLSFPHGFNAFEADNSIFFNAFHPEKGFQLFQLKGERLIQVSYFKQKLEKKEVAENLQGAQTSNYAWFNNQLYFFAKGKGVETGLYSYSFGKPKLVYECEAMSNGYLQSTMLSTQVVVPREEGKEYHHIIIDSRHKIVRYKLDFNTICTDLIISKRKNYAVLNGLLGELTISKQKVHFYPVNFKDNTLEHVRSLKIFKYGLLFVGYKDKSSVLGHIDRKNVLKTYIISEGTFDNFLVVEPKLSEEALSAYFMVHSNGQSTLLHFKRNTTPKKIKEFRERTEITSSTYISGQPLISCASQYSSNVFMLNSNSLEKVKLRRLTSIGNITQLNDELVFIATEETEPSLFALERSAPPMIANSSFDVFDFWKNGRIVGRVSAKSNRRMSTISYSIISGNKGDAFEINSVTGEIRIKNAYALKSNNLSTYKLGIQAKERLSGNSIGYVTLSVKKERPFTRENLRETLMFFPDFSRPQTLTTNNLPDGEVVLVYDVNFKMVDLLFVKNGAIVLPSYPPGIYVLNVRNKENLYQKIELQ